MDIEIQCEGRKTVCTAVDDLKISYEVIKKISPYAEGLKYVKNGKEFTIFSKFDEIPLVRGVNVYTIFESSGIVFCIIFCKLKSTFL